MNIAFFGYNDSASHLILASLVFLLHGTSYGAPDGRESSQIEEIRRGVAIREASIQNLSARITYKDHYRHTAGGPFSDRTQVMDAIWVDLVRARIDMVEEPALSLGRSSREQIVMTSDEQGSRRMNSRRKRKRNVADQGDGELDGIGGTIAVEKGLFWIKHPALLLQTGPWSPLVCLDQTTIEKVQTVTFNGETLYQIDWTVEKNDPPGSSLKGSLWVDPAHGYVVRKSETSRRPTKESAWKEIALNVVKGIKEVNGIWLPETIERAEHTYRNDGGYELKEELVASFEEWKINVVVAPNTFHLDFPDGTIVTDYTREGITYTKGKISDVSIKNMTDQTRLLLQKKPAMPPISSALTQTANEAVKENRTPQDGWLYWSIFGLLGVLASIYTFKRLKRSKDA